MRREVLDAAGEGRADEPGGARRRLQVAVEVVDRQQLDVRFVRQGRASAASVGAVAWRLVPRLPGRAARGSRRRRPHLACGAASWAVRDESESRWASSTHKKAAISEPRGPILRAPDSSGATGRAHFGCDYGRLRCAGAPAAAVGGRPTESVDTTIDRVDRAFHLVGRCARRPARSDTRRHERHRSLQPRQALRRPHGGRRRVLLGRAGRDLRHPRPQRRRQDHDGRIHRRTAIARFGHDPRPRPRPAARPRRAPARRRHPAPAERAAGPAPRRRSHRPVRLVLRRAARQRAAARGARPRRRSGRPSSASCRAARSNGSPSPSRWSATRRSPSSTSSRPGSTHRPGATPGSSSRTSATKA